MSTLNGKAALVTGASRGIGREIALKLASEGASVAVNYSRSEEAAREVVAEIEASGGHAVALRADLSDIEAGRALVAEAAEKLGGLDILVNNAGVYDMSSLAEATPEQFQDLFALNVRGLFFVSQAASGVMRDGGRIVNISSAVAAGKFPGYSLYAATKAGVNAFTSTWARELGGRGITVNSVSPGPVETEMLLSLSSPEMREGLVAMSPLGRIGQPGDIADIVAFLCSDQGRWITGRDILADGGMS